LPPGQGRVLEALVHLGVATAKELALELGITPMAVRHHLRGLVERALVTVAQVRHSRPGHPERVWAATSKGRSWVLPGRYALLARALLAAVTGCWGAAGLTMVLEKAVQDYVRELDLSKAGAFGEKLEALVGMFDGLGIAVRVKRLADRAYELALLGCAFPEVMACFPEEYGFCRALAEAVLGVGVTLELGVDDPFINCVLRFQES